MIFGRKQRLLAFMTFNFAVERIQIPSEGRLIDRSRYAVYLFLVAEVFNETKTFIEERDGWLNLIPDFRCDLYYQTICSFAVGLIFTVLFV